MNRSTLAIVAALSALAFGAGAAAQPRYDPGASDTEIRIGNTAPYTGPASINGAAATAFASYFRKINDEGGINGRRIRFISLDDGYSPPRTVEGIRKLVEQEGVLLIFGMAGTAPASAVQRYLNGKKVPQLFVYSGAARWGDPQNFPWTMGWYPDYVSEAGAFGAYLAKERPNARIGILYQNDDFGKDYVHGLRKSLPGAASRIVEEVGYDPVSPTIESELGRIKASGADVLVIAAAGRAAVQAVKRSAELGFETRLISTQASNVGSILTPAGLDNAKGLVSTVFRKDAYRPQWDSDAGARDWRDWMKRYNPEAALTNEFYITGYSMAQTMVEVLKKAGDDLTRTNIMRQAASLDMELPLLLPGIRVKTSPTDFFPIQTFRMARFDGERWTTFGDLIGADTR